MIAAKPRVLVAGTELLRDRCSAPVLCRRIVPKPLSPAIYQSIETAAAERQRRSGGCAA